jgi:hypothetical protein
VGRTAYAKRRPRTWDTRASSLKLGVFAKSSCRSRRRPEPALGSQVVSALSWTRSASDSVFHFLMFASSLSHAS